MKRTVLAAAALLAAFVAGISVAQTYDDRSSAATAQVDSVCLYPSDAAATTVRAEVWAHTLVGDGGTGRANSRSAQLAGAPLTEAQTFITGRARTFWVNQQQ